MTTTTDAPLSAVNALIGWYANNVRTLEALAADQGITLDELVPKILDEAMTAHALRLTGFKSEPGVLQVQDIRLDERSRQVWRGDEELVLARLPFDVLALLMRNAGTVVTRRTVANQVWNDTIGTVSKTMDMHISWIRRALGDEPKGERGCRYITTVRGVGWRMEVA